MLFVGQQSTSAPGPAGCAVVDEFAECPPTGAQVHRTAGAVSLRRGGSRSSVSELQERLLDTHRVMTTAQLMEITAAPERTTEYRMATLAQRGLVGRVRPPRGRALIRGISRGHHYPAAAGYVPVLHAALTAVLERHKGDTAGYAGTALVSPQAGSQPATHPAGDVTCRPRSARLAHPGRRRGVTPSTAAPELIRKPIQAERGEAGPPPAAPSEVHHHPQPGELNQPITAATGFG
jgi:hypothetical protein